MAHLPQRSLGSWLDGHKVGGLFYAPFDVVEPDLLYVSNARADEVLTPAHVKGVPAIVIEIGSPSTRKRDETIKRRLCERAGADE
jgi:Uma2 family endonuclease